MLKEDITEIKVIYNIDKKDEQNVQYINIFGAEFVENNKNKCKMIINNK